MIETPSLLSPCGSYQVDFYFIKGRSDLFLRIGTFEGKTEFKECVTEIEMILRHERAMEENETICHKLDDHLTDIGRGRKLNG